MNEKWQEGQSRLRWQEDYRNSGHKPKNSPGYKCLGEDGGFIDTFSMTAIRIEWLIKIYKICKLLSNSPQLYCGNFANTFTWAYLQRFTICKITIADL